MCNEILYYTAEGVAIYKGEKPPTAKEVRREPESYSLKELNNMSHQKLKQLSKEMGD